MQFEELIKHAYTFKGESILIGAAMQNGQPIKDAKVFLPLRTMNRHGLIAGATGTGKNKNTPINS
jgi:Bacterial protein of unknown function (DUF853).